MVRDRQLEPPAAFCGCCAGEVYEGEPMFRWEGRPVCRDCFIAAVEQWVRTRTQEAADALGVEVCRTEEECVWRAQSD